MSPHPAATPPSRFLPCPRWGANARCKVGQLGWAFVGEVASQRLRARTAGLAAAMSVVFGLTFNTAVPVMRELLPFPEILPTYHASLAIENTLLNSWCYRS